VAGVVRTAVQTSIAMSINNTFNTNLLICGTGRGVSQTSTVVIIQALNALIFSWGTSLESVDIVGTVRVSHTDNITSGGVGATADPSSVTITEGSKRLLGSSPLSNWAVSVDGTLDAATTFNVAVRGACICTVGINGTEVDADTSEGVTVRVSPGGVRWTIEVSTVGGGG